MVTHLPSVTALGWESYYDAGNIVSLSLLGRYPIRVQDFWVPAVEAMELALFDYEDPCDWIGSLYVRNISGSVYASWHSYGAAIDLDYGYKEADRLVDKNPHLHRKIYPGDPGFGVEFQLLEHQVHAIEAIRTNSGKRVWRWLGWPIGDTMHFEPACSPDDIKTGVDPKTLPGGSDMNCPWINTTEPGQPWYTDRAPCQDHYSMDDAEIEWGVNTGVCNVPSWGENGIDYGIVNKYLNQKDNNRDDFVKLLSYGEWLTMKERATD